MQVDLQHQVLLLLFIKSRDLIFYSSIKFFELYTKLQREISISTAHFATKMEQSGTMYEEEWASASLKGMYPNDESEFMTQFLGEFSPSSVLDGECLDLNGVQSNFFPCQMSANAAVCISSQETSTLTGSNGDREITNFLLSSCQGAYYQLEESDHSFSTDNILCYYGSMDFGIEKEENVSSSAYACTDLMMQLDEDPAQPTNRAKAEYDENLFHADVYHQETKFEIPLMDEGINEKVTRLPIESKKRPHNVETEKNTRNVKPKRCKKISKVTNKQTTSSNCSKDDASTPLSIENRDVSSLTMEEDVAPSCRNGKMRANRGSATDPQSLYARKRRGKINERLRILQSLVPNGTKVDISTMLDEAVQYVKFLQLQIKLLSSEDMWMYAPLAYNGMDLGLDI